MPGNYWLVVLKGPAYRGHSASAKWVEFTRGGSESCSANPLGCGILARTLRPDPSDVGGGPGAPRDLKLLEDVRDVVLQSFPRA